MTVSGKLKSKTKSGNNSLQAASAEMLVDVADSSVLQTLVGAKDDHLKTIERELDVRIGRAPDGLIITGQDTEVELAQDLLVQLRDLLERGEQIFAGDVERAILMLSENRRARLEDLFHDQVKIAGRKRSIVPKTFKQREYIESIKSHDIVFGVGPAGTGKTYLAMAMAISALVEKQVKRVVLCRPAVEAGEKLGFLPGDMAEKVNPYLRPLYDALHDMVDYDKAHEMVERGMVEVAPLAFMRGRTLSRAFVILDEAQNTTSRQMKMLLTRLGQGSKCVVSGDETQTDLPRGVRSGLVEAVNILKGLDGVDIIRFGKDDVIRHSLVASIVDAYETREEVED